MTSDENRSDIASSLLKVLCNEVSRATRLVTITADPCQLPVHVDMLSKINCSRVDALGFFQQKSNKIFAQDKISVKRLNANATGDGSRVSQLVDGDLT